MWDFPKPDMASGLSCLIRSSKDRRRRAAMGLNRRFAQAGERKPKESLTEAGLWEHIIHRINQGTVIPILSNSFRMEQIFREENPSAVSTADSATNEDLTVEEKLT